MVATGNWRVSANCRNGDPERLFVKGAKQREARTICRGCPVLVQCLSYALDERIEFGVWGGMTERERRAMLRARPDVRSWASFLTQAAKRAAQRRSAAPRVAGQTPTQGVVAPPPAEAAVTVDAAKVEVSTPVGLAQRRERDNPTPVAASELAPAA